MKINNKKIVLTCSLILLITLIQVINITSIQHKHKRNNKNKRAKAKVKSDPEIKMSINQLVTNRNYKLEEHDVTTKDRYILKLFRLSKDNNNNFNNKVVLLQHGLMDSSDGWLVNERTKSIAYQLVDIGYDVWLGNNRGNKYSKEKSIKKIKNYWNFSMEEFGLIDQVTFIDFILQKTGQEKITYIGHSQGCAQIFILCSLRPNFCSNKINGLVLLAPAAIIHHATVPGILSIVSTKVDTLMKKMGLKEMMPSNVDYNQDTKFLCKWFNALCNTGLKMGSDHNIGSLNKNKIKVYMSHFPSGTSLRALHHYAKIIRAKKFISLHKTDKSKKSKKNKNADDSNDNVSDNREYPVSRIQVPMSFYIGLQDRLVVKRDVEELKSKMNNRYVDSTFDYNEIGHLGFLIGDNLKDNNGNDLNTEYDDYIKDVISKVEEYSKDEFVPKDNTAATTDADSDDSIDANNKDNKIGLVNVEQYK